jgi:RHS repeat-associated protein
MGFVYDVPCFLSRFTGKERDSETGLDYFGARYYGSNMGRWMSPDWAAKPEPIPYAKLDNPQSLNLYGYVLNNPVTNRDPDGHICIFGIGNTCAGNTPPPPIRSTPPPAQPLAQLKTDMKRHTTTLMTTDKTGKLTVTEIETKNDVAKAAKPGAADPYSTHNVVGVSNRHAGQDAYGPAGAFIDTGDSRGRAIHGGGTGLPDPMAPEQGWKPTMGCTRGQNEDVIKLGQAITDFKKTNPDVAIPYVRE